MRNWKAIKYPLPEWQLPENQQPHVSGRDKAVMAAQLLGIGLAVVAALVGLSFFLRGLF